MSGFRAFVRTLGYQPGNQLNPILDATDGAAPGNVDQIPATIARLTRGRIDRPFRVNRNNFLAKTGAPVSVRANALNEAKLQVYEALQNGAPEVVLQRLVPAAAAKSFAVISLGSGANLTATVGSGAVTGITVVAGGSNYVTGDSLVFGGPGSGAVATITASAGVITAATVTTPGTGYTSAPTVAVAATPVFSVASSAPSNGYLMYLMHNDCFNDGIKLSLHADQVTSGGSAVAASIVKLRVYDSLGVLLNEFEGSLDSTAVDDFGKSKFLPDVISSQTASYDTVVAASQTIPVNCPAYGRDTSNNDKWVTSAVLVCFSEGGTTYANTDYDTAISALRNTVNTPFGQLWTGGSQAVSLLSKMVAFAIEINTPISGDVPGSLSVAAAITFLSNLNIDTHYASFYWTPIEADDPLNGGKLVWGASGLNIAMRCARNALVNAKGFAPKNAPIAGVNWPLNRTGMRQLVRPEDFELSDLAKAKINPVVSMTFTGGSKFVFTDSLTASKTTLSYKKLISVAEMSSTLDTWITQYSNELLQLPMSEYVKKMSQFMEDMLNDAVSSNWLVPSKNLRGNAPFEFTVSASSVNPAELVLITYWASYDGVARQAIIQQTLVK